MHLPIIKSRINTLLATRHFRKSFPRETHILRITWRQKQHIWPYRLQSIVYQSLFYRNRLQKSKHMYVYTYTRG